MKDMFTKKLFWSSLFGLAVIIIASFLPGFGFDVEHTAALAVVVATFVVGAALSPGDQLKPMLLSRKFWTSAFGVVVIFLDAFHALPAQFDLAQLASFVVIIAAYGLMLAIDPGRGWRGLLVSRKFWSALVGLVFVFLDAFRVVAPLAPEQIVSIALLIAGAIAGAGLQKPPEPLPDPQIPPDDSTQIG